MHSINNVYISGLGAIGMTFAGLIHEADPGCLRVIADEARIQRYTREGTAINGKPVAFRYLRSDEGAPPADLLIIVVKHHQLEQSIHDIRNFIGENTTVLSLLNGIVSEETIGTAYGAGKLLYSYVVGTDATREGTHVHYLHQGRIVFGERSNKELSPRVSSIKDFFDRTGIPCEIPEDMIQKLWWKLMLNVGVNQVSAVLKAPYGVFRNIGEAQDLMRMAEREVLALSKKAGIGLGEDDIESSIRIICSLGAEGKTSMLQDIETHRKTEVEIFSGTVMELGRKYGIATPINDMLFKMIRTMEKMWDE